MAEATFVALVQNAALLLAMALFYDLALDPARIPSVRVRQIVVGVMIGAIGLVVMMTPFEYVRGIVFDTRSVLLGVAGLFFGAIPTAVAMAMTAALRLADGGAAAWTGVSVILASGIIGIAWRRLRGRRLYDLSWREAYLFGLVIHAVMLALMFTLPWAVATDVIATIGLPVMVIYPGAAALLAVLLASRLRRERDQDALHLSEERLRLTADAADLGLYDLNVQTGEATVNERYARMLGYDPTGFHETIDAWIERLHPDDRDVATSRYLAHIAGELREYRAEFRLRTLSGEWRWILSLGEVVERDSQGTPLRMLGTYLDTSERKQADTQLRANAEKTARLLEQEVRSRRALLSIVEDQRAAEAALRESEARFRAVAEFANDGIVTTDETGAIVAWNRGAERIFGYTAVEVVGQPLTALIPEQHRDVHRREMGRGLAGEMSNLDGRPTQGRGLRKDTTEVPVDISVSTWDVGGRRFYTAIVRDITERKASEEALARSEELLNEVQEVSLIGGWAYDVLAKKIAWTQEVYRIHEVPPDYDPNDIASDIAFYLGDDRKRVEEAFTRAIAGEPYDLELQFVTAKGNHLWVRTQGQPRQEGGRTVRIVGNIADITERKRAEQALQAERDRAQRYLDIAGAILVSLAPDRTITLINKAGCDLLGYPQEKLVGRDWFDLVIPERERDLVRAEFARMMSGDIKPLEFFENSVVAQNGEERIISWHNALLRGAAGAIVGTLSSGEDITERKAAEAEIRRLNESLEERVRERTAELEAANRELETFSYSVSHDLRAPLRAITGFAEILGRRYRERLDEKGRHYLDTIVASGAEMGVLIEELLDYARLGRTTVRREPVPLAPLVIGLRSTFGARIAAAGATLAVREPLAVPLGDPVLIERILVNLVENSLLYRRPDLAPLVTLSSVRHDGSVTLAVADNGIGIPAEFHERIFAVFVRLHGEEAYPGGTGIGLSIVRKGARLMGSEVTVESVEGVGSTFSLVLPAASEGSAKP